MAELADALDLGSSVNRRAGSTPVIRIMKSVVNVRVYSTFFIVKITEIKRKLTKI